MAADAGQGSGNDVFPSVPRVTRSSLLSAVFGSLGTQQSTALPRLQCPQGSGVYCLIFF